jgi:hypothetical protein
MRDLLYISSALYAVQGSVQTICAKNTTKQNKKLYIVIMLTGHMLTINFQFNIARSQEAIKRAHSRQWHIVQKQKKQQKVKKTKLRALMHVLLYIQ